ncbi:MAG: cupin domain-containing protein [Gemmatimonadaceae bacterium]|nr:cupin domain-containing protein [Gemmatimonadaceae bacterium]
MPRPRIITLLRRVAARLLGRRPAPPPPPLMLDQGDAQPRVIAFRGAREGTGEPGALPPIPVPADAAPLGASDDGGLTTGLWESPVGVFDFHFQFDEIIYLIEGEVVVHTAHGSQLLRRGDVGFFPRNLRMRWEIRQPVRKMWIHRYPRVANAEQSLEHDVASR